MHAAELKIFSSCKLKVKQCPLENNIYKRDRNHLEDEASEETNAGNLWEYSTCIRRKWKVDLKL